MEEKIKSLRVLYKIIPYIEYANILKNLII